jgi:hypothetical protein
MVAASNVPSHAKSVTHNILLLSITRLLIFLSKRTSSKSQSCIQHHNPISNPLLQLRSQIRSQQCFAKCELLSPKTAPVPRDTRLTQTPQKTPECPLQAGAREAQAKDCREPQKVSLLARHLMQSDRMFALGQRRPMRGY